MLSLEVKALSVQAMNQPSKELIWAKQWTKLLPAWFLPRRLEMLPKAQMGAKEMKIK